MAQVELSLSAPLVPRARMSMEQEVLEDNLDRWSAVVAGAAEPSLVIDSDAMIVAASESCCEMFGFGPPASAIGRFLLDGVFRFVDFTAARGELAGGEIDKIAPLLALSSGRLARGLIRVQCGAGDDDVCTADAIATPLWQGDTVVGSLTFFSVI